MYVVGDRVGNKDQLEIVSILTEKGKRRRYTVKCHICCLDQELHGDATYTVFISNITSRKAMPCGCSSAPKWTEEQYKILVKREADRRGFIFKGWYGEYKKNQGTKLILECPLHGVWKLTNINGFLSAGSGCPKCARDVVENVIRKSNEEATYEFLTSGVFHPDTKFWRSDSENKDGYKLYWKVYCPVCDSVAEAVASSLKRGSLPCRCSSQHNQNIFYVYAVYDKTIPVALKFGITNNPKTRGDALQSGCVYAIKLVGLWEFDDSYICRKTETTLKRLVYCGTLSREEMRIGWTETTSVYNLEKIIKIVEDNGGIRIET